jgi:hypothetical protein
MNRSTRRRGLRRVVIAFAAASLLTLTALVVGAGADSFFDVQSGTLTMTSDPGDFVGQGVSYSYATPQNTFTAQTFDWAGPDNQVAISMQGDASHLDDWQLRFAAPPGEPLTPGTYTGAVRTFVAQGPGQPGLDVFGQGRGCNTVTGSFTVLHATFEQHCNGDPPALRGEIDVSNPPPPPAVSAQVTIDANAQLTKSGNALVSGTLACSRAIDPTQSGIEVVVSEPTKEGTASGEGAFAIPADCGPTPTPWQVTAVSDAKTPFVKGTAGVTVYMRLVDPFYNIVIQPAPINTTVTLKEA